MKEPADPSFSTFAWSRGFQFVLVNSILASLTSFTVSHCRPAVWADGRIDTRVLSSIAHVDLRLTSGIDGESHSEIVVRVAEWNPWDSFLLRPAFKNGCQPVVGVAAEHYKHGRISTGPRLE